MPAADDGTPRPARLGARTIAVLVDALKGTYQATVVAGLADAARRRGVSLAVFAGGVLGAPGGEGLGRNFVFDLAHRHNVDGAVILSGALGNHLGPASVEALCARLGPLPVASIALSLPASPSLLVDEEPGLRQALEHLLARHARRRIAFIRGPIVNAEAERRFAIYRAVLAERGLGFDAALVCDGTFEKTAGEAAIAELCDERQVSFDAVVACNDYMALGAIPALQARGIEVPQDVAVIGFDDIEDARYSTPPLTTVRQPLYQQGEAALSLVLAQIDGGEVARETTVPTELVLRQSCGCLSGLARPSRAGPVTPTQTAVQTLFTDHGDELRLQVGRAVHGADSALPAGWDRHLLDALDAELRGVGAGLFTATLDRLLGRVVTAGEDVATWQGMISVLRRLLLPALVSEPPRWVQAEDLWHEARILIGEQAARAQAQHRLYTERLARALTDSSATLLATQDATALIDAVRHQLPRLGVPGAWLALLDEAGAPWPDRAARFLLRYDAALEADPAAPGPDGGAAAPLSSLALLSAVTRTLARRASLIVEPLFFRDRPLGCLMLEMGPREGIVYESLAEQVSSALEGARLVARLVDEATRRQAAERARLEKEMQIAAHIQTSVLPRDVAVAGLEFAASMHAATEVGGDYYDVIPVDDGCWIGIGDVAGHGLGTGLVMLMMQSGIGALARRLPNASPRDIVLAVNTMLVENVRYRLGQREHATLTLLRYRRDGTLTFAGAHEEILVVRAATGRCERFATPGPWVSAKRDIDAGTVETTLRLLADDVLVLFTDGLIEAVGRDAGARFGTERLIDVVERHRAEPPAAIRDAVLAAVAAFAPRLDDDVTLLIARYRAPG